MAKYISYNEKLTYSGKRNQKKIIESTISRLEGKVSPSDLYQVKRLRHEHRQLALEKKKYNKQKSSYTKAERKEMRGYFERWEKRLDKKFKKIYDLKWDRHERKYKQQKTGLGVKLARFNRYGMTDVETKIPKVYAASVGYNPANDFIRTKEEFIEAYGGSRSHTLRAAAVQYNIPSNWNAFYDMTSSVGWIIRFRDYLGVSPEVDAEEFVEWCAEAGLGGIK